MPFFKILIEKNIIFILSAFIFFVYIKAPLAEELDSKSDSEINMVVGEISQIKVYKLTRISITDPSIADIVDADNDKITIVAKTFGETSLFIWDQYEKRVMKIYVANRNPQEIKERIESLLKAADIHEVTAKINEREGKVVLSGDLPEAKEIKYEEIIKSFFDDVINLVEKEQIEDLVQIEMQITELSTTLKKAMGIKWSTSDGGGGAMVLNYPETLPELDGSIGDFFKIGDFERTSIITATVDSLVSEGKARVLSQPKLMVLSGQEASFLVGGEIPIRTSTLTTAGSTENVEFKQYGVGMTITPLVRKNKIDVKLNIEISNIDQSNPTGSDVAFTTNSASTQLLLDDGQTVVLAGLIKTDESDTVNRVAYLSKIPIAGLLFRHRSTPHNDKEIVITLTPHRIISNSDAKKMADQKEEAVASKKYISNPEIYKTKIKRSAIPEEMVEYVRLLQEKISQSVKYPSEAQKYGWEGTVKLGLHILPDGTLGYALVKESSGHEIFDDDAVNTATRIAPYAQFPANTNLQELEITVPIVYSLERN